MSELQAYGAFLGTMKSPQSVLLLQGFSERANGFWVRADTTACIHEDGQTIMYRTRAA
jgi:hypothetical protein